MSCTYSLSVIGGYSLPLDLLVAHSERLRGTLVRVSMGTIARFLVALVGMYSGDLKSLVVAQHR
jgi:hypothetical protein